MKKIDLIIKAVLRWIKLGKFNSQKHILADWDMESLCHHITQAIIQNYKPQNSVEKTILDLCTPYLIRELKDSFVLFLETEGVRDEYEKELMSEQASRWRTCVKQINSSTFDVYLNTMRPQVYFYDAFLWAHSKRGDTFWRDLNEKWFNVIKHHFLGDEFPPTGRYNCIPKEYIKKHDSRKPFKDSIWM